MSTAERVAEMVDMLPDSEQAFAFEFVKRLVLAWDPDFTKVTPPEAVSIQESLESVRGGEFVRHEDIDWN